VVRHPSFPGMGLSASLVTFLLTIMITLSIIVSYHVTALSDIEVNMNSIVTMMIDDVTMMIDDVTVMIKDVMSIAVLGIHPYAYL
jgi:hypothetical protein